ncbi:MAG: hypothetical protein JW937_01695 [Candidatus Omnitrophica bacterium]|nr:hypothetical protein [Candidatus Omnitrophota bacterium]
MGDSSFLIKRHWEIVSAVPLLLLFAAVVAFVQYTASVLALPGEWNGFEGIMLFAADRLFSGEPLYSSPSDYPFVIFIYPPLYPLLLKPFLWLFGPSLLPARLISVFSVGLVAGCLWHGTRKQTSSPWIPWAVLGLFFGDKALAQWYAIGRVDPLAAGLSVFAVYWVAVRGARGKALALGLGCAFLAAGVKQTGILAVLAILCAVWRERPRKALRPTALTLLALAGIWMLLAVFTRGGWLVHTGWGAQACADRTWGWNLVVPYLKLNAVLLAGAAVATLWRWKEGRANALDIFYALLWVFTIFGIARKGSSYYYFIPVSAIACFLFGYLLLRLREISLKTQQALPLLTGILLLAFQGAAYAKGAYPMPTREDVRIYRAMSEHIAQVEGPVLMDTWYTALLRAQRPILFEPNTYYVLEKAGAFQEEPRRVMLEKLLADIEARRFKEIVAHFVLYLPEVQEAIDRNYEVRALIPMRDISLTYFFHIYVPRELQREELL